MKPLFDKNTDPGPDPSQELNPSPSAPDNASTPSETLVTPPQEPSSFPVDLRTEPAPRESLQEAQVTPIVMPKSSAPLAWLGIVGGPGAIRGHTFVLRPANAIGRSKGDILLAGDATISSQHAQIRLESKGSTRVFVIYDMDSTNGTFVGTLETVSDKTSRIKRRELRNGDYVLLGKTLLVFLQA